MSASAPALPAVTELELPQLAYLDPELRGERFHATMAELAAEHWLAQGELGYFVLHREPAERFLRSKSTTFPGMTIAELFDVKPPSPLYEEMARNILHVNGADHSRLRGLVNPFFTPRAADRWRPVMRGFLEELWAGVEDAGRCEFVEAFAQPYPSLSIAAVMGAAREDAPRLHYWSNWIQRQFDAPSLVADRAQIEDAVAGFYEYAYALLERRRGDPRDDLVSALLSAEEAGDRLSDVECVNLVTNVLVGGVDTTQSQLAHAIRLFAEHPEQWALLAERPEELARAAVEEVIRFEPITPVTARIVLDEMEVGGVRFPEGTILMICAVTANREGEAGDRFDITLPRDGRRVLTFGAGTHYCLGANLARAELEEALAFLAPRMPNLALDGEAELGTVTGIYGVERLPVCWG